TLPTTIGLEKQINPFLRCQQAPLVNALQKELAQPLTSPLACFKALRLYKDRF
ncbi:MAG: hydroxyacylglutathione hydrolase, partial [Psychromonas sp.]|nr:hydroxyacylglutathione hydrolase [Psychromonas sp.]